MRWKAAGVGVALALTALDASAQSHASSPASIGLGDWALTPLVEVRTRGEYRRDAPELAGTDVPGNDSSRARNAYGVLERTRLGLCRREVLVVRDIAPGKQRTCFTQRMQEFELREFGHAPWR